MSIIPWRKSQPKDTPKHTAAAVRAARTAAGTAGPHDAALPGTLPAPAADDTIIWRVPALDGGPGFVIPQATLGTPGPRDGEPGEKLPAREPGATLIAPVPVLRTEPADPAMLRDLRDALKALPALPGQDECSGEDDEPAPAPAAYLRAVVPGGEEGVTQIQDPIGHSPLFAGSAVLPDGRTVAGMYLGTNSDGWFVLDALSAEWCEDAITALTAMRDYLVAAREPAEDGEAA